MQDDPSTPKPSSLKELCTVLHEELKEQGLETADVPRITQILSSYSSDSQDWREYCMFEEGKYTRNLVDDGNGKFNLMILCWAKGVKSPIHDHSNSHCLLKVLDGDLKESLYDWPKNESRICGTRRDSKFFEGGEFSGINLVQESTFVANQVTYMHDKIGLHSISNPTGEGSVSLHLYSPPFAYCKTFCEKTGEARSSGKCVFYSTNKKRNKYIEDIKVKQGFKITSHTVQAVET